jgi:hypothetical protein
MTRTRSERGEEGTGTMKLKERVRSRLIIFSHLSYKPMLTISITLSNAHHEVKHVLVFESDVSFTEGALDKRL